MNGALGRSTGRRSLVVLILLLLLAAPHGPPAAAAIYRWDNGQLITEIDAEPGAQLIFMDLSYADLQDASLSGAGFWESDLTSAHLMRADLTNAALGCIWECTPATLTDADFGMAIVRGADFSSTTDRGFTAEQLYSTASYQSGDLTGIDLDYNDLTGWDFVGKNLSDAVFGGYHFDSGSTLTDADFTGAVVRGAGFYNATSGGFTAEQLYSTASYQNGDLTGVGLWHNDLGGWDFAGKNLTAASFGGAILTHADLSGTNLTNTSFEGEEGFATLTDAVFIGAVVRGAKFSCTAGFTKEQLYSTATYQRGDLTGIGLGCIDLSGSDFAGKDLTGAYFGSATLTDADLSGANLTDAYFGSATLTDADLSGANLTDAHFGRATLTDANLSGANLTDAYFLMATLTGANLSYATLADADFTGAVVSGTDFSSTDLTAEQFYSTASYKNGDLTGIGLGGNDLTGWDFAGKIVRGANFDETTSRGFTAAQLYSTSSYKNGDLTGIHLGSNDLSGWDFAGKNLTHANFENAILSLGDLRGAEISASQIAAAASTEGAIMPDGRIEGLVLDAGERLRVWDYNGEPAIPITVESAMSLDQAAFLRMVFEDDGWGSTISFEPGIAVSIDGSLELMFADEISPASLIGTTFDLFDWDGVTPTDTFAEIVTEAEAVWDTSNLYTTGEVTLLFAIPEPSTLLLALVALAVVGGWRKWRK